MKSGKFVEVLLFASGLGLSLITNLFTSDSEVLSFYETNKKTVLLTGAGLIILSLILSFKSESSSESNTDKGIPLSRVLGSALSSAISWVFIGALIGLIVHYVFIRLNQSGLTSIPIEYFVSISTTITGLIVGYRFYYLDFDEILSVISGGIIGYAASYYFPLDVSLNFLPVFLTHDSIVASVIVGATIGLFTGIFKPNHLRAVARGEQAIRKSQQELELITAKMKQKGFFVKAHHLSESVNSQLAENMGAKREDSSDSDINPVLSMLVNRHGAIYPPYIVYDLEGKELHRFSSLSALEIFFKTL